MTRSVLVEVKPLRVIHENTTFVFNMGSKDMPDWMRAIVQYKETGVLLIDSMLARKLKLKSLQFCMVDGELYKKPKMDHY